MARIRGPFQGVGNIIRFNWHFYLFSLAFLVAIFLASNYLATALSFYLQILFYLILSTSLISLLVSYYVYDRAGLYELDWLTSLKIESKDKLVNINAGFDETSILLKHKYAPEQLLVLDFYDPAKHTEISIKRARNAYPPFAGTQNISTSNIPIRDASADYVFLILSAHEIRIEEERNIFFQELQRILKPSGKIILVEHLRDLPNFLAYSIGFFHFYSKKTWEKSFQQANFKISQRLKITPFITSFILQKNGIAS